MLSLIEASLQMYEAECQGKTPLEQKRIIDKFQLEFKDYVDFSFQHNGYRDVIKFFNKKESHRKILSLDPSDEQVKLTISGINMGDESKYKNSEKCNLASSLTV